MTLPNFITIARIFMVPAIVWLLFAEAYQPAFFLFLLAGLSDALDGFVAKQFNQRSELGAYLDPLADKVMLVAIYVLLGIFDHLPNWLVILVVSRDVAIVGGVMLAWVLDKPMKMEPNMLSKANTTMQILLVALVLGGLAISPVPQDVRTAATVLTGLLTAASLAVYLRDWLEHMANGGGDAGPPAQGSR